MKVSAALLIKKEFELFINLNPFLHLSWMITFTQWLPDSTLIYLYLCRSRVKLR